MFSNKEKMIIKSAMRYKISTALGKNEREEMMNVYNKLMKLVD